MVLGARCRQGHGPDRSADRQPGRQRTHRERLEAFAAAEGLQLKRFPIRIATRSTSLSDRIFWRKTGIHSSGNALTPGWSASQRDAAHAARARTELDALARHRAVEEELATQLAPAAYVRLSREFAELGPVVQAIKAYRGVADEIADLESLLADASTEPEMRTLAAGEKPALEQKRTALEQRSGSRCCPRMRWTSTT